MDIQATTDYLATPNELEAVTGIKAATIRKKLRRGEIKHAERIGNRWLINVTKQYPKLGLKREIKCDM